MSKATFTSAINLKELKELVVDFRKRDIMVSAHKKGKKQTEK